MYTSTKDSYSRSAVNPRTTASLGNEDDDKYVVTSRIMVVALAILFAVVLFVVCLHLYARWIWSSTDIPAGRRVGGPALFSLFWRRRRRHRTAGDHVVTDADVLETNAVLGLDKSAVEALPTFRYCKTVTSHLKSAETGPLECAICLGEFREAEMGRTLPKCGHSFHLGCIDMWLFSHSTCPLCRAVLEPYEDEAKSVDSETAGINPEATGISRRLRGREPDPQAIHTDEHTRAEPLPETLETLLHPGDQEHETAKRTDSIPANVLFWGNPGLQLSATVINTSLQATPFQVAIDIDADVQQQHAPSSAGVVPNSSSSPPLPPSASVSNFIVSPISRTSANFRRLLSRGRLPPSSAATTEDVDNIVSAGPPSP